MQRTTTLIGCTLRGNYATNVVLADLCSRNYLFIIYIANNTHVRHKASKSRISIIIISNLQLWRRIASHKYTSLEQSQLISTIYIILRTKWSPPNTFLAENFYLLQTLQFKFVKCSVSRVLKPRVPYTTCYQATFLSSHYCGWDLGVSTL